MSYNLLFDTEFTNANNNWKFVNCYYEDGYLISNDTIFGIEQEIILPDITKLYFRVKYSPLSSAVKRVFIGIQNEDYMSVTRQFRKGDKERYISVVEEAKQEKIKIHLIFESDLKENKISIKEPILCDLYRQHKVTWLKFLLDHTLKYRVGYSYKNLLPYSEINPKVFGFEKAKVGSIVSTQEKLRIRIPVQLEKGKRYLIKLDYLPINDLGEIHISYGVMKSIAFGKEQLFLLFRAMDKQELYIYIEPNDVLPYQINLKRLMLVETDGVGIDSSDIPYLPFV